MQTKFLTAVFLFAAFGATQDVDLDDFPRVCNDACRDISKLSNDCDNQTDNDRAERDCVCNADNAQQHGNNCAACVKANISNDDDDDDDDDDDLRDLFRACGWNYDDVSSTSSSATSGTSSSTSSSVITTTETVPATTTTHTSDGTTSTEVIPATTVTTTEPASPTETDAAPGVKAGVGLIAAGLIAALPVVL